MAVIAENVQIAGGIYRMRLTGAPQGNAGQFVMLRIPGVLDPFLGRPISLFDSEGDELTLIYQLKGRGTAAFAALPVGATIDAQGPYGNGFPLVSGEAAASASRRCTYSSSSSARRSQKGASRFISASATRRTQWRNSAHTRTECAWMSAAS